MTRTSGGNVKGVFRIGNARVVLLTTLAAFMTYFSMYAFRKPYTAGLFEGITFLGVNYKILLVTLQLLGYTFSKIIGIRFISGMLPTHRALSILALIGASWLSLLLFALIPAPYNCFALFLNGLPLGLIWGIVFSYVEGRRFTELLAAGLSISFIISSGVVKNIGRVMIDTFGISEYWMPFLTGAMFVPILVFSVWLLQRTPDPTPEDIELRQKRDPMNPAARKAVVRQFLPGILLLAILYLTLSIFRDVRDNFAVDIWKDLGYLEKPSLLSTSELLIAFVVLIITGSLYKVKSNWNAFKTSLWSIPSSAMLILAITFFYSIGKIHPIVWMILMGFGMYLPYIIYNTILFERWIAALRMRANVGFLIYIMDSVGYFASLGVLIFKNYVNPDMSWGDFFEFLTWISAILMIFLGIINVAWFSHTRRKMMSANNQIA